MSAMSNYLEAAVANAALRGTNFTSPGQTYLALCVAQPLEDGSNIGTVECVTSGGTVSNTYPGYARQSMGVTPSAAWTALDGAGMTQNGNTITFPALGGATSIVITHWAIFDAASGGNMLFYGPMTTPKTLDPTDVPSFPPGSLRLTFN